MLYVNEVWNRDKSQYHLHRIPGMTVTSKGTLIIYNEARYKGNDWAPMDIFLQRSEDGGKTFGDPIYLANTTETVRTVNNPVMMEDRNGRLHFLYCENYAICGARVLQRISTDDGISWGEPIDITAATLPEYRNVFAIGPGHGIRTTEGALVVPVWLVPQCYGAAVDSHFPSCISTLYSLDDGASWQMGELMFQSADVPSPSETEIALTRNGHVYLNARTNTKHRAVAYSDNGYTGWSPLTAAKELTDPSCFGSVVTYDRDGTHAILFSNCNSAEGRVNVTVRASLDDGKTFPVERVIDKEHGGYVETAVDNEKGLIYVLYETDWGKTGRLAVFDLDFLLTGKE